MEHQTRLMLIESPFIFLCIHTILMETEKESVRQLNLIAAVCIYEYDAALFFLYLLQSKCCIALKVLNNFVDSF